MDQQYFNAVLVQHCAVDDPVTLGYQLSDILAVPLGYTRPDLGKSANLIVA